MKKFLGIDLGGTSAKVGVVNQQGIVEHDFVIGNNVVQLLPHLISEVKKELASKNYDFKSDIQAIGFATPGFIDVKTGVILGAYNLGWVDFDLKAELKNYDLGVKDIFILNDANAAALGEFWVGAGNQTANEIFYTLGTGIGGAIILNGQLFLGENGFAGEFGHGGNHQNIFACTCGLPNCLEAANSATSLAKTFKHYLKIENNQELNKYFHPHQDLSLEKIAVVYQQANKPQVIRDLLSKCLKPLVAHMSTMVFALNPKIIIVGGGGSQMGENLLEIIRHDLNKLLLPFQQNKILVKQAVLGNKAGLIGAAYYALKNSETDK
ncbi:ROK family protein [Williamsoniiplasma lucivorax]|uniref:Glucokinase n=1 Tax=Williamsoniiplasma lucivorax TaxID=209274 RepID=A0A2S5RF68_9MOLU|nr:ROK family protein [Williamsoniiplasma lucivorax]PPE05937.1 glucokinase [Williamsoniiplasma lucivorax]